MEHRTLFTDVETTGVTPHRMVPGKRVGTMKKEYLNYETDYMEFPYIVSLSWAINDEEPKYHIINQEGRTIPQDSIDIHGITDEMAAESKHYFFPTMLNFMVDALDSEIVVGHNLYFDTSIIKANILREIAGGRLSKASFDDITEGLHKHKRICTMRSTAKMMHGWPSLSELHMKIFRRGFPMHNAKEDLEAMRRCYIWLLVKGIVPTFDELMEKAREKENES